MAAGNVTNKVSSVIYGGDNSTNGGGNTGGGSGSGTDVTDNNFNMYLSLASVVFDGAALPQGTSQTGETRVIGFKGQEQMETYIGIIDQHTTASDSGGEIVYTPPLPANYGITGVTTGMSVEVQNNATTGTTLSVIVNSALTGTSGTLLIPCNISMNAMQDLGDDILDWVQAHDEEKTMSVVLEYTWSVTSNAQSAYRLDLSNDTASVNSDEPSGDDYNGHVLPGANKVSTTAMVFFGTEPYTSATFFYSASTIQAATGLTGYTTSDGTYIVETIPGTFDFKGDHLDIEITAFTSNMTFLGMKTFTIRKSYPSDGKSATSYWMTFSPANQFKYNPNTFELTPTAITVDLMMQVGQETPTAATGCSIWYGYDGPPTTQYVNGIEPNVNYSYVSVKAVKGSSLNDPIVDGIEQLPILRDGVNGSSGTPGESVYRLDLTNENASINCDSDGNILAGAVRPTCTAKLYLGTSACTNVTYSIQSASCSYTGVSINSSTGVMTFNSGTSSSPFNFNTGYTSIEFTIQAKINNVTQGTAVMTVSRNKAGSDGTPARSYWLALSADAVKVSSAGTATPSAITAQAYAQIGDGTPYIISNVIKWGYNGSTSNTYTSAITVDTTKNYMTFRLMLDDIQRDIETVPILHDGKDGSSTADTRQGPAIRGPYDWYYEVEHSAGRRWCNGSGTTGTEDAMFLDVIIKDGVYYYCNTSYTEQGQSWSAVQSKWTSADTAFDFVAAHLILADEAKINFLTDNEIYLMNSAGTEVTAGAAGGGEGIAFWAGGDKNDPDLPFRVNHDGSIYAESGTFGGYIQMKYAFVSRLQPDYHFTASTIDVYLSQTNYRGMYNSPESPENPHSGDTYASIDVNIERTWYYYTTYWRQVTNVGSRGFIADKHAYLVSDGCAGTYGMGDGATLVLPAPSQDLNGFIYDILVEANYATRGSMAENPGLAVITVNNNKARANRDRFHIYCFSTGLNGDCSRVLFYGGHVRLVCLPVQHDCEPTADTYAWGIIEATGGFDLCDEYTNNNNYHDGLYRGFSALHGYSIYNGDVNDTRPIYRIQAYKGDPGTKSSDTLYVSRN